MNRLAPPLFPDRTLVSRIEAAEAELAAACARVASGSELRATVLPIAGGIAAFARPGAPSNKAIGLALDRAVEPLELAAAEAALRERGEPLRIELSSMAHPQTAQLLTERGYQLVGFENVLGARLATWEGGANEGSATTERVDDLEPWLDVLVRGICVPDDSPVPGDSFPRDVLEGALGDVVRVDGLVRYLAHLDGQPAGAASVRLHGGVALLNGASTLQELRRRGVQRALLRARLAHAKAVGAEVAVLTAAPGSRSQANAMRHGFSLLYVRAILVSG